MQSFDWLRDLGDQLVLDRRQRRLCRARRARQQHFLVPLQLERLEQRALLAADFGDAPAPYPTLLSENGARHEATGPQLGATRDSEADGIPSAAASADRADEDGVTFGMLRVGALDAAVTVNVQEGTAKLDAWIDFNADGNWGGPGERIFASRSVTVGDNALTLDVPAWAKAGSTFARFRLSTVGALGPIGGASTGEVEDYAVSILPPVESSAEFVEHGYSLNGDDSRFERMEAADIDGDGDLDVLASALEGFHWYEREGAVFTQRTLAPVGVNVVDAISASDLDGDGDLDVLAGAAHVYGRQLQWYENDGNDNFTLQTISDDHTALSIEVVDFDLDGDLDVLAVVSDGVGERLAWYENDGGEVFTFRAITGNVRYSASASAADVDGDGDLDVVSALYLQNSNQVAWFENNGSQSFISHAVATVGEMGAAQVAVGDLDGDGDPDFAAAIYGSETRLAWYLNDGLGQFTERTISAKLPMFARRTILADLDGDRDLDIVPNGSRYDGLLWYENDGGANFAPRAISTPSSGNSATVADWDGDGDLDLLSAWNRYSSISWHENVARATFAARAIPIAANAAQSAVGADVDGDGDVDLLSAYYGAELNWFENDGQQNFTPHTVSTPAYATVAAFADVDSDGDVDVLTGAGSSITWHENDGNESFTPRIVTAAGFGNSLCPIDLDGDGDLDVLSGAFWYQNDGSENFTARTVATDLNGGTSVTAADVDGDGDWDVLSASRFDDEIAWHENDGSENFTARTISSSSDDPRAVSAADLDGDGDLDILSASSTSDYFAVDQSEIAWYENDGNQTFTKRVISRAVVGALAVVAADMDSDGDQDVLSASRLDNRVAWYENDGNGRFEERSVNNHAARVRSLLVIDLNDDGDLDVLATCNPLGEASRLEIYENQRFDFGDAPAPFPTTRAEDGASHEMLGPMLGATRDFEAGGILSPSATADAGDDGVTLQAYQAGQLAAPLTVNVQGGPAKLDAWIDFNGDGNWGGPGEQIFASHNVVVGNNPLTFAIPAWAKAGTNFARFRLSTAGGLGPAGEAADGEVEDYAVTILPPVAANGAFSGQKTITAAANGAIAVFAADLDGDGDQDVLSASRNDNTIAWYENNGAESFATHAISTAAQGAYSVTAADVDGDGDLDVLSASFSDDKIAWYENDGNQNFTQRIISLEADGAVSVAAADLDGDGDVDILSASTLDDKIGWYENDGQQNFIARTISVAANGAFAVTTADVDRDGDLDVLSASSLDDKIAWYENDGHEVFTAHTIATADGARSVSAVDLDGDGDLDVLSASALDDRIAWYENDGSQNFTPSTISNSANGAWSVSAADLDGDGDFDVLSASYVDNKIAWYENDGGQSFTARTLSTAAIAAFSVIAADVNGDGNLDVLSASAGDDKIAWYAQDATPVLAINLGATAVEGAKAFIGSTKLSAADSDSTPAQLVFDLTTPPRRGQLELSTKPGVAIASFTQAHINANQVRYQHDGSETNSDSFAFMINDGTGGRFGPATFNLTITPASGAPVLNTALNPTLTTINEDAKTPGSTLVSNLINGAVTDPDAGALRGIAVTTASNFNGVWQYSLNNGGAWTGMGAPSASKARLLPSSARVRFLPKLNFNGTVQIFYRAWDQTAGTAGGTLPVIGNRGGAKSMSFAQESAKLTVKAVNDKPVLGGISGSVGYVRNAATAIVLAPFGKVTDVDSANFAGGRLRVRITDGASSSNRLAIGAGFTVDAQGNVKQGTTIIGKRVANGFGTNELIVTFNANATKAIVQQLVRAITFKTVSGAAGQRKVVFTVSDGDGGLSGEVSKTVNVT